MFDDMDLVVARKRAKTMVKKTVAVGVAARSEMLEKTASENLKFVGSAVADTAKSGVKMLEKTELGGTIVGGGKALGKRAKTSIMIVGKTQLGATVLDGGKMVGDTALMVGGTLTETLADGANLLGSTVLMGTDLIGQGVQMLIREEDDGSAFFHDEPAAQKDFDHDFDDMLPMRFHDPKKEREVKDSMRIEWDEESWSKMDGDPEKYLPKIIIERTASQKKLESEQNPEDESSDGGDEGEESSLETDASEEIYFTDAEMKAKQKAEKRERKRLRKEKNGMSKLKEEDASETAKAEEKKDDDPECLDEDLSIMFGKSFHMLANIMSANENKDENVTEKRSTDPAVTSSAVNTVASATKREENPGSPTNRTQKMMEPKKKLWGELRGKVVSQGVVETMKLEVRRNHEFLDLFNEGDDDEGKESAAEKIRRERENEKVKFQKLRKQLDDYEANLEKERNAVNKKGAQIFDEKNERETQFKNEVERNAELTRQLEDLNAKLEEELEKKNNIPRQHLQELQVYNEVLQQQVQQQDTILRQLHREKVARERKANRKDLYGADQSHRSTSKIVRTVESSGTTIVPDYKTTGIVSIARSFRTSDVNIMRNDLTEMNDELDARRKVMEMQAMELENLKKELQEAEDAKGIAPLKDELDALRKKKDEIEDKSAQEKADLSKILVEKKEIANTHAEELSKLKLEKTKKEMKTTQEENPPAEQGGLFGMLWGDTSTDKTSEADILLSKLGL